MSIEIGQREWDALAARYGAVSAQLLVYEIRLAERDAEVAALRQQLVACADELHAPLEQEGSG
ncbi:MAG TPA: hypothetical protein VMT30_09530 [Candidatus Saccharimonadia bacterium]|nr:hypothetical protein [Candidatus Saccharimonadia bacterium]